MPKLKGIQLETAIIERYKRRECSVEEALIEIYLAGVSVRRVEDITELLWGTKVSNKDGFREILEAAEGMKGTNNLTERVNREIRRRTRAIGAFPDGNSALMLVCARLRHVAAEWGSKRYMDMEHLFKMEIEQPNDEENPYI